VSEPAEMVAEDARRKADQALLLASVVPVMIVAMLQPLIRVINEMGNL
jgi:hypothetical protein